MNIVTYETNREKIIVKQGDDFKKVDSVSTSVKAGDIVYDSKQLIILKDNFNNEIPIHKNKIIKIE